MDSLTHALIITIILALIGRPDLALYGILGAVLIDVDVLFSVFSNGDPRLYIFTHGGFTHSFLGAFVITVLAVVPAVLLSSMTSITPPLSPVAFMAIVAGAASHITVDYLAYPGIPLLYPLSDKKYTLGIMGGPSAFIMLASVAYIATMAIGMASIDDPWPYIAFFALVMALGAGTKAYASIKTRARTIATMNPLRWLVIEDRPDTYLFYQYDLLGRRSPAESYEKYKGITRSEAEKNDGKPEIRRMKYHSYIVAVEKNGEGITYRDPIREKGHIWYPPYFKSYNIKE